MALGLIEVVGLSTAMAALDAASKCADVRLTGMERVIGVGKQVSVTLNISGTVADVRAAVEAGVCAAERVGTVISSRVIASPHEDVNKVIALFEKSFPLCEE